MPTYGADIDFYRWHPPVAEDTAWIDECISTSGASFIFSTEEILDHADQFRAWRERGGPPENAWGSCILSKIETGDRVALITGCFDSPISYSIRGIVTHPEFRDQGELLNSSQEMGKWILYRSGWGIREVGIHLADPSQSQTLNDKWSVRSPDAKVWKRGR